MSVPFFFSFFLLLRTTPFPRRALTTTELGSHRGRSPIRNSSRVRVDGDRRDLASPAYRLPQRPGRIRGAPSRGRHHGRGAELERCAQATRDNAHHAIP